MPLWVLLSNSGIGSFNLLILMLGLAGVFACVVLHELGHALMARFFGIGTESITLYPIGGVARLQRMSEKPFEEICIALAGPAVTFGIAALLTPFALAGLFLGATPALAEESLGAGIGQLITFICFSNVWLLLFNLLPCFPMDGGRVLRAVLAHWKGQLPATELAVRIGLVVAFFIACLSLPFQSPMPIVVAVFVLFAGQMELMSLRQREAQRRAARFAGPFFQPVEVTIPSQEPPLSSNAFSGVAWDSRHGVWVQWQNGRPVAYWG